MNQAIGKIKEDREVRDKRVDHLKAQTEIVKHQYKEELEEVMKEEQECNKGHKELIHLGEYFRNT